MMKESHTTTPVESESEKIYCMAQLGKFEPKQTDIVNSTGSENTG